MWVIGVVHHQRPAKPVTVLGGQVAVIPEGASLTCSGEVVQERVSLGDRALVDRCGPICPVSPFLEESMPVLKRVMFWVSMEEV